MCAFFLVTRASLFSLSCATGWNTSADGEYCLRQPVTDGKLWLVSTRQDRPRQYSGQQSTAAHAHLAPSRVIVSRTFRSSSVQSRSRVSRFGHLQPARVRTEGMRQCPCFYDILSRQDPGPVTVLLFLRFNFVSGPRGIRRCSCFYSSTLRIRVGTQGFPPRPRHPPTLPRAVVSILAFPSRGAPLPCADWGTFLSFFLLVLWVLGAAAAAPLVRRERLTVVDSSAPPTLKKALRHGLFVGIGAAKRGPRRWQAVWRRDPVAPPQRRAPTASRWYVLYRRSPHASSGARRRGRHRAPFSTPAQ